MQGLRLLQAGGSESPQDTLPPIPQDPSSGPGLAPVASPSPPPQSASDPVAITVPSLPDSPAQADAAPAGGQSPTPPMQNTPDTAGAAFTSGKHDPRPRVRCAGSATKIACTTMKRGKEPTAHDPLHRNATPTVLELECAFLCRQPSSTAAGPQHLPATRTAHQPTLWHPSVTPRPANAVPARQLSPSTRHAGGRQLSAAARHRPARAAPGAQPDGPDCPGCQRQIWHFYTTGRWRRPQLCHPPAGAPDMAIPALSCSIMNCCLNAGSALQMPCVTSRHAFHTLRARIALAR